MYDEQYQTKFCIYLILLFIVNFKISCSACTNLTIIYLSNCYFNPQTYQNGVKSRILDITVARVMNPNEDIDKYAVVHSTPPYYVRMALDIICSSMPSQLWSSLELSPTLNGEFVRTELNNILFFKKQTYLSSLYLLSGTFFVRNLTKVDCQTNIQYRTNTNEIFKINIQLESNYNDTCNAAQNSCYPTQNYLCDEYTKRCTCRPPLLLYQTWCVDYINITNCTYYSHRCIRWCEMNDNADCICPQQGTIKKQITSVNNSSQIQFLYYCEILPDQHCQPFNTIRRCPLNQQCINAYCTTKSTVKSHPTISSIELILIVLLIAATLTIIALVIVFYLFNQYRHRKQKHLSPSLIQYAVSTRRKNQNLQNYPQKIYSLPNSISRIAYNKTMDHESIYDNHQNIYGAFRNNVQVTRITGETTQNQLLRKKSFSNMIYEDNNHSDDLNYQPYAVFLQEGTTAIFA